MKVCNEPWCSFRLQDIPQSNTKLGIVLQFQGEHLISLTLFHDAARFGTSWADWSEERELSRKAFHDLWLSRDLCVPAGKYSWGDVSSSYDAKSGSSSITIRYSTAMSDLS